MKKRSILILHAFTVLSMFLFTELYAQKIEFSSNKASSGLNIESKAKGNIVLNYSVSEISLTDKEIDGEQLKNIQLPNSFLPNDEGMPDLPGESKMIAIPFGSNPKVKIISYDSEVYQNINIAPAPKIPLITDENVIYKKNKKVYESDAYYPNKPVSISKPANLRGVNAVTIGITPFQYNPVKKELIVYKNIKFEIEYDENKTELVDNRLRNKYWEKIYGSLLLNYSDLPALKSSSNPSSKSTEAEYIILTLDDADFLAWADSIAEFRRKQGITCRIVTLSEIGGNTESNIENWINNAYNTWATPPVAVLLLGDYSTGSDGITSHKYSHPGSYPDYASDNMYADVDGDELPDIIFARITAENATQLETMVSKFINYESAPPTDPDFYEYPISALGWQDDRWFQICSEVVGGFWSSIGKSPVRINELGSPANNHTTGPWSTATNTSTVLNYFGPSGLGYLPATPQELGGFAGGTANQIVNAINNGAFMLQHRDHGYYGGWGEPAFNTSHINQLTNVDNKLPFIFSINCQTGAFHNPTSSPNPVFTEAFHRYSYNGQNSGALGLTAATEVSYSFVNDAFVWGMYDNMWPDFMPSETTTYPVDYVYPAFANAAGKHFLQASSWPYNSGSKTVTHRLFHHHGGAFLNVYTEVPQDLTVTCPDFHTFGETTMDITVDNGADIAVTYFNTTDQETEILGIAESAGGTTTINLSTCPNPPTKLLVTITKQNYFRYTKEVQVIAPSGPFDILNSFVINDGGNNEAEYGENFDLDITLENIGVATSENVLATLTTSDTYVDSLKNATAISFGDIAASATASSSNSFSVYLANDVPNNHTVNFDLVITDNSKETYNTSLSFSVNAPNLTIGDYTISDPTGNNDGILDPDETADLIIQCSNTGSADITNTIGSIGCASSYITINSATTTPSILSIGATGNYTFNITADGATPVGTPVDIFFSITGGEENQYSETDTKEVIVGFVPEYCDAGSNDATDEFISRVQFVDIDNSSVKGSDYTDYTHISTDITIGETYPIIITNGEHYSGDQIGCWIDWNYDGDFEDANETITISYSEPNGTGSVIVPASAKIGSTTMRLRVMYTGTLDPCGNASYGEVEDYTVNVITTTPTAQISSNPDCGTGSITVTSNLTGVQTFYLCSDAGSVIDSWMGDASLHEFTGISDGTYKGKVDKDGNMSALTIAETLTNLTSPVAATSVSATSLEICEGTSTQLTYSGGSGETFEWYTSSCGGTAIGSGNNLSVSPTQTTTYYGRWENTCGESTCKTVTIDVNPLPEAPTGVDATSTEICSGSSTTLSYTGGSGNEFNWYEGTCNGTSIGTGNNLAVTPSTTTTYYGRWENSCGESSCESIAITVTGLPTAATTVGATSLEICNGGSTELTYEGGSGEAFKWYTNACGGTLVGTGNNLSVSPTANTTYYGRWENTCGESTCKEVTITINEMPNAPTSVDASFTNICEGEAIELTYSGGSGSTFSWYENSCNGTSVGTGNNLTLNPTSTTTYYGRWENACGESTCESVTVNVNPLPQAPTAVNAFVTDICSGGESILSYSGGSGDTFNWYEGSCNGILIGSGNDLTVTPTATTTYYGRWENSCGESSCESVTITISSSPVAPTSVSASNLEICAGNQTNLTYIGGSGYLFQWYTNSCGGTAIGSGNDFAVNPTETTTYYGRWENACGVTDCEEVTVVVNPLPQAPTAVSATTENICNGESTTISYNGGSGDTFTWYTNTCGGTSVGTGNDLPVTPTETTTYYGRWENSCGESSCESITINVGNLPVAPTSVNATATVICPGENTVLSYEGGSGNAFEWYSETCGGTSIGSGNNLSVTPTETTTYYGRWENSCGESSCESITITVGNLPVAPTSVNATATEICSGESTTLSYNGGSGDTFTWYTNSCGGTSVGTGNDLSVAPTETTTYYGRWENDCGESECESITITVNELSVAATAINATATEVCLGDQITLSVEGGYLASGATWVWYSGTCGGSLLGSGATIQINPTENTEYFVRAEGGCNTTTCTSVSIEVYEPAFADAGEDQTITEGETVNLSGSISGGASSATWSSSGSGEFSDVNSLDATYTPSVDDISTGEITIYLTTNDPEGPCAEYIDELTVTINELMEYTVSFVITDENQLPIEGAEIDIAEETIITNSDGIATIELVDGEYGYSVTFINYQDATGVVTIAGSDVTEEIGLIPDGIKEFDFSEIRIFPNPSQGLFNVELPKEMNNFKLTVVDVNGKVVRDLTNRFEGTRIAKINLQDLVEGVYYLRFEIGNSYHIEKLIIE